MWMFIVVALLTIGWLWWACRGPPYNDPPPYKPYQQKRPYQYRDASFLPKVIKKTVEIPEYDPGEDDV